MPSVIPIDNLDDPRLDDFVRLRDVQWRQHREAEHGFYVAEGHKIIERALLAGHEPRSLLLTSRWLERLADVLADRDVDCYVLAERDIETVTGFHVHRGALAAMKRPAPRDTETFLATKKRLVVLEDLVDHANVGAVFRNAAALGFDGIVLSPRCADPWYRRAVKVSMGAVFAVDHVRIDDWYEWPQRLAQAGFVSHALTLAPDAVCLADVTVPEKVAIVIGSEGHGLSEHWQRSADVRVTIPMRQDIDSLNAAATSAVVCWHYSSMPTGQSSG